MAPSLSTRDFKFKMKKVGSYYLLLERISYNTNRSLLIFVPSAPDYDKMFNLQRYGRRVVNQVFDAHFHREMDLALSKPKK